MNSSSTVIIGGGLAGLSCAARLASGGHRSVLLEATDRVGGRVRTDHCEGFTLDHGFQVLLTAYPACQQLLDYEALRLRTFEPGALVRQKGAFAVLGDPWRRPTQAFATLANPVGSLADKLRIARLRHASRQGSLQQLYSRPQTSTLQRLKSDGFSDRMIDQFFRPFLGGVFLDESLECSSRMLEFVFRMFASGEIAIPADGMAAIPRQLADGLPQGSVRLRTSVTGLRFAAGTGTPRFRIALSSGDELTADRVVVAVESDAAARLLSDTPLATQWSGTTTIYYAADAAPDPRKLLMLRGDEEGPIQTAVILSNVAPEYAPPGKALLSVSVDARDQDPDTGETDKLDRRVRAQLASWFGAEAERWKLLRTYRVPFGLPKRSLEPVEANLNVGRIGNQEVPHGSLWMCGDHRETPSIQGAMHSGIKVADAILAACSASDPAESA